MSFARRILQRLAPRHLHHQLALLFALMLATSLALHAKYAIEQQMDAAADATERQARGLAETLAQLAGATEGAPQAALSAVEPFRDLLAAAVTDQEGKSVAAVRRDGTGLLRPDASSTAPEAPPGDGAAEIRRPDGRRDVLIAWSPIRSTDPQRWVRAEISRTEEMALHRRAVGSTIALGLATVILASLAVVAFLRRPLAQLREAAAYAHALDAVSARPLPALDGSLEIRQLREALDRAAQRLFTEHDALAWSEERHRGVLDSLAELVFQTDARGRWTYLNRAWERITRIPVGEALGRHAGEFVPAEDRDANLAAFRLLLDGQQERLRRVLRYGTRGGGHRWLEVSVRALRDGSGRCIGMAGSAADVTERQMAEERLRDQLRLMRQLIEVIPAPVYIKDAAGRYLGFNRAYAVLVGRRRRELLGRTVHDLFPLQLAQWHEERDRELLATGGSQSFEAQVPDATGRLRDTIYHKARFSRSDGRVAGIVGVIIDISERKGVERELVAAKLAAEAANMAKSAFLATMSHEIRTPMNAIIGMTDLTLDSRLQPEQREHLTLVKQSADALLTLINDVLDFSRADSGRIEYEHIPFSLRDCVGLAVAEVEPRARQKRLDLRSSIADTADNAVIGDPYRLRQVLLKLLGNAVKFTPAGSVMLTVEVQSATRLRFSVRDTGIGVPVEQQASIFDAFTQADPSATRRHGGTGIGLAICARLVAGMGGRIEVDSTPGAGSTFHFSLPLCAARIGEPGTEAGALRGLRALLVGAGDESRRRLEALMRSAGIEVHAVPTIPAAAAALDTAHASGAAAQFVVLDNQAGAGDACGSAAQLRGAAADVPIVVVTAAGLRGDAARCRRLGVAAYLAHPLPDEDFLRALQMVMGRPRIDADLVTRHTLREHSRGLDVLLAGGAPERQKRTSRLLRQLGHRASLACDAHEAIERARGGTCDAILIDVGLPGSLDAARRLRALDLGRGSHSVIVALSAQPMTGESEHWLAAGVDHYLPNPPDLDRLALALDRCQAGDRSAVAPSPPPRRTFDRLAVLENLGGDLELLHALATTFLDSHGENLRQIQCTVRDGDWDGAYRAAHALKGAAANFSAASVVEAALELERAARAANRQDAESAARRLEARIDALAGALRAETESAAAA